MFVWNPAIYIVILVTAEITSEIIMCSSVIAGALWASKVAFNSIDIQISSACARLLKWNLPLIWRNQKHITGWILSSAWSRCGVVHNYIDDPSWPQTFYYVKVSVCPIFWVCLWYPSTLDSWVFYYLDLASKLLPCQLNKVLVIDRFVQMICKTFSVTNAASAQVHPIMPCMWLVMTSANAAIRLHFQDGKVKSNLKPRLWYSLHSYTF